VVVFQVQLEVRGQFVDARGEQRNLNFRAAGVGRTAGVGLDDFSDGGKGQGHAFSSGIVETAMRTRPRREKTRGLRVSGLLADASETDRRRA
jgi:hypothetical protein